MDSIDIDRFFSTEMTEHAEVAVATGASLGPVFCRLVNCCRRSIEGGGTIFFFGNGGSAADAQHLATELTVRYRQDRPPIAALALTTDGSALTAAGNDLGFDEIFARQLQALAKKGDVALAMTTSGRSPNVLRALEAAKGIGMVAAAFGGKGGGALNTLADPLLIVPSETTARIQEMHLTLGQILCGALEKSLRLV